MTVVSGLTREDLAALRAADNLSFHHHRAEDKTGHMIRAYLRQGPVYTARQQILFPVTDTFERTREIAVQSTIYSYSGWSTAYGAGSSARAFASVSANHAHVDTIVRLLRVGDEITLTWTADNNTQHHADVGYNADQLLLRVNGPKSRKLTFHVAYSVGPDNSARMVRQYG